MSVIKEWRQKEVMAELSGRLLIGLDDALQFAEEQAQAKAPRRTGKLRISVAHDVVVKGNSIAGRLGIRRGKGFAHWGWFQEMGTVRHPAQPFLRPAVFGNAAEIVRRVCGG